MRAYFLFCIIKWRPWLRDVWSIVSPWELGRQVSILPSAKGTIYINLLVEFSGNVLATQTSNKFFNCNKMYTIGFDISPTLIINYMWSENGTSLDEIPANWELSRSFTKQYTNYIFKWLKLLYIGNTKFYD